MEEEETHRQWRFWPLILISTVYPINAVLMALSIPIYFFQAGVSVEVIGFLAAALPIAYSFSPILFSKVSDKIGRKASIVIAMAGTGCIQLTYFITLEPVPFFIARFLEGLIIGLYWANLQACISDNTSGNHEWYIARFNLSWNAGCLLGYIIGAFLIFTFNDLEFVFKLSPLLAIFSAFVAILFFQDPKSCVSNEKLDLPDVTKSKNPGLSRYRFPVLIPVMIVVIYSLAKASVNFLYPIKSEMLGFETFTIYLLLCVGLITQIISMLSANLLSGKNIVRFPLIIILLLIATMFLYGINESFVLFVVLYIFFGLFTGVLYGISLRLFLNLNVQKGTSRYSFLNESIIGFSFFMAPILAGQAAASVDINLAFQFFAFSFIGFFVVIALLSKKIRVIES